MTVLMSGAEISAIGPAAEVQIPHGAQTIDGRGKFLIPGLWDMHMHLSFMTDLALPVLVANGVTAIRDMGGDLEEIDRWRTEISSGTRIGPRILRCGLVLDGPRDEEARFRQRVANAEEGRAAVRALQARGVDFLKVYHFLSREAFFAIADEAKQRRIAFAGHIPNGVHPLEASDAGMRSAEHIAVLLQAMISVMEKRDAGQKELTLQALSTLEGEKGDEIFARFARNHTWHTPTLVLSQSSVLRSELAARPDPRREYVAPRVKEYWDKNNPVRPIPPEELAERRQLLGRMFALVGKMQRAGVQLLAGTDPPTRDVFPGFSLHDELALLVEAGLTPLAALQTATRNAAECLGLLESTGTIERGKSADVVLLEADPLADIRNTTRIAAVVLRGKVFDQPALQKLLESAKSAVTP
jgi:imidazolonepropionase-like amidohydrolase